MNRFLYVALMLFIQANNTVYYVVDSVSWLSDSVHNYNNTVKPIEANTIVLEYILYQGRRKQIFIGQATH